MDRKVNCRVIISIILCMTLITGIVFPCNVYAAKKVIGLVSEQEYLNKYTNKEDFTAVPYYRYATRSKETTTSGYSSLSGWTSSGKKLISSNTGSWSRSAGSAGTSNDSSYETVTKVNKTTGYEYYVWVCNHKTWFWKNNGAKHNNGTCRSKNKLVIYSSRGVIGSKDSDGSYTAPKSFSPSSPGSFSTIYGMTWNGATISSWTSGSKITPVWRGGTVTYYKTTVEKYQYSYWKWGSWSSWSDWTADVKATGDTCKKDSTVMYYVTDIRKENQTITGTSSYNVKCGDPGFSLNCTTNGDSILNYTSSNTGVVTVSSSGYVNIKGAGTATITVKAPMTENYKAAQKTIQITVTKKTQTISGSSSYRAVYGDESFAIDAAAQTELSYATSDAGVAEVDQSGYVIINGAGTATITVTAAESDIYKSASKTITVNIAKASQGIDVQPDFWFDLGDAPFYLDAKSETGQFRYSSSNTKIATVSTSGRVTIKNPGKAKIYITALSDSNYKSAKRTVYISVGMKTPELSCKNEFKKIKFTWSKVPGAGGYKVYVYDKNKKKYICKMTKKSSQRYVVIREPKIGKQYKVKVRAYKVVNGRSMYSPYSNIVSAIGE